MDAQTGFDRRKSLTDLNKPPLMHKAIQPALKTVY